MEESSRAVIGQGRGAVSQGDNCAVARARSASVEANRSAADAPAFLSFDLAAAEFFGVTATPGGRDGQTKRLRAASTEAHFALAGRVPAGSWIALHRGHELLDRRGLDPAWGGLADVELELDPLTEVEVLISGGEIATTEFKRQLPADDRDSILTVMKTVAAFANGDGGTLLFGVENDGTVCGLAEDIRGAIDRLTLLIRDWVKPLGDFQLAVADVDGKNVLRVEPGTDTPYGVGTTERRLDYYVRRGGTTFPATPADVRAFVRARLPASNEQRYFPR